ncbi:MAG: DEAD/DEAH box helicase [Spirochaetaceae bacterium]|nr:MAG: DEAD/DEAH box helicase [Spirochaetaceae bacterium]
MDDINRIITDLRNDRDFMNCVTRWERLPQRPGCYEDLPEDLDPRLQQALRSRGIERLYVHQARAYANARSGRDSVVVTPTASGKTLCYNLPVLQTIIERPETRALYLFPTKALSQDQQSELGEVVLASELGVKVATYDGDTPESLRASARETGQIVISNPDMLHAGVLPNHPKWIKFLKHLRFVVIDELHSYRGVFGSHVTNVVRRLGRICRFYNTNPVFICSSATIGNPLQLAQAILERQVALVDENGAPAGERYVVLYNPPLVDRVQGIRRGVVNEAQKVAIRLLRERIKTIVFSRSRVRTELIADYINKSLANVYTDNARIRVESYRGGYLPSERRAVERGLRDGSIHGVVSTNALELGIDIGGLDAAILGGFPGSISSSWQQLGRAGRRRTVSLAILIASSAPLDQYMVKNPDYFFGRAPESAFIDPDNIYVLMDHLKCAVFELPFGGGEGFPGPVEEHLALLEEEGTVRLSGNSYYWADRGYPAEGISLRSATSDNVVIIDTTAGAHRVIGEMDRPSAKEMLFDNAIYLHRGEQYVVLQLDLGNRRALVERSDVNYFTDALVKRDIKVLHEDRRVRIGGCEVAVGDILVRTQVAKFKKIRFRSHENIGYGTISLPEEEMHTRAVALVFADGTAAGNAFAELEPVMISPAMTRIGAVIRNVAPFFLLCDARDIGLAERLRDPHFGAPALYIYDAYPGGSGLAEAFVTVLPTVLSAARDLIAGCPCEQGCPSCVGPRDSTEEIAGDPKLALRGLLEAWLGDAQPLRTTQAAEGS